MIQKINRFVAKNALWIFLAAATYKFVFVIMDIVNSFRYNGAHGVRTLFEGLLEYTLTLLLIAVLLEVSRKIAESEGFKFTQSFTNYAPQQPVNYIPQAPAAPAAPAPAPTNAPAPASAPVSTVSEDWFCAQCGTKNIAGTSFCSQCGRPKQ